MPRYEYAVWFRDTTHQPDDEDYEWVACFLIDAPSAEEAKRWGDHLATERCAWDKDLTLLSSEIEATDDPLYDWTGVDRLPVVECGVAATDDEIGW